MAQAVTVRHGDTITRILKENKALQQHEIHTWLSKLGRINPHISDLNRIYPGESILIPDTSSENVPRTQVWANAFSKIPRTLCMPYHGPTDIYFVQQGDTIDTVARYMFSSGVHHAMPASSKRALLIHNNPYLENHLSTNRLPANMLLNITPAKLGEMEKTLAD
jgi:phage tail protein X